MSYIALIAYVLLRLFWLALIVRIVVEMVESFSRRFDPPRWFMIAAEPVFRATDPPVRALRRVIPPLRMGGIALDMSVIVLFLILSILTTVVAQFALSTL